MIPPGMMTNVAGGQGMPNMGIMNAQGGMPNQNMMTGSPAPEKKPPLKVQLTDKEKGVYSTLIM